MTRIVSGSARGRRLKVPKGSVTRPTTEKVREALFNVLQHRYDHALGAVLDLFAGAGTLGLEALSRGADSLVMVEADARVARVLKENAGLVSEGIGEARLVRSTVARFLAGPPQPFDTVFMDPPYARGFVAPTLQALQAWLAPEALVCVEHPSTETVEAPGYEQLFTRSYGDCALSILALSILALRES